MGAGCAEVAVAADETNPTTVYRVWVSGHPCMASWVSWLLTMTKPSATSADRDHINADEVTRPNQHELGSILVTHPGHPLWQQRVRVVRRYSYQGERQWVIELPDGSRQYIPASWCAPLRLTSRRPGMAANPSDLPSAAEAAEPLGLATLRELAALVRHLQEAATGGGTGEAAPTDRERGRTTETTRSPGASAQQAAVAEVGELPAAGAATAGQPAHPDRAAPTGAPARRRAGPKRVSRP
jgi:hypothetical protein